MRSTEVVDLLGISVVNKTKLESHREVSGALRLTFRGRVDTNNVGRLWRETVKGFNFGLTLLESYDSEPPTEAAANSDLTLITSLGWSF